MGELYGNSQVTGVERFFDDIIVSKTDLEGKITYANRTFMEIAGFPDDKACIGQPHNVIRHPDMPRAVFLLLWKTLQSDQEIFAYVINRALNGDHYWVLAHVTPSHDMNNNVIGYHSPIQKLVKYRKIQFQPKSRHGKSISSSCRPFNRSQIRLQRIHILTGGVMCVHYQQKMTN
jgi:PAS domain S-box-containing protein